MAAQVEKAKTIDYPRRGDIYLVSFDPTVGHEIRKTRPALVIQNDVSNRYSPITIVAAVTSSFAEPPYPTEVILDPEESGLPKRSVVVLNQIRSVDRQRLIKLVGHVGVDTMERVDEALGISLGLLDF
jgi:mRNA interferase MazF